jgi:hypothetical protein
VKISTEALLTSADAFGIRTATPAQRAACRVLDGAPLGDLADHPDVVALLGGTEAVQSLCALRSPPVELAFLASIRSAKTIIACAAALRAALSVDVSPLGPGEVPRVSLVSVRLDTAQVAFRMLLETVRASRALAPLLLSETTDTLELRHPSGRPIEVATVAGSKAGSGLVSRWSAGVIFDEAPRMNGSSDGVISLDDARAAVLGRLLPGAQALYIGSPWAPYGPVYDMVQEHWGKPSSGVVVLRGTGPMLNPVWWTPERCLELQERNPTAYATDVCGEFADPESGLLNPASVRINTRVQPLELEPEHGAAYAAAVDPAEGSAGGNAWTLVIVQRIEETEGKPRRFRTVQAREWRGVRPEQCLEQIAEECRRFGLSSATSDQYAGASNQDLAARYGLQLNIRPTTAKSKLEDFTNLATLVHTDCLELAPEPTLRRDLLSVKRRTTQQGVSIVLPKTGDGRHCDFAPALATAVSVAANVLSDDDMRVTHFASARSSGDGRYTSNTDNSLRAARLARWRAAGIIND